MSLLDTVQHQLYMLVTNYFCEIAAGHAPMICLGVLPVFDNSIDDRDWQVTTAFQQ